MMVHTLSAMARGCLEQYWSQLCTVDFAILKRAVILCKDI